MEEKKEREGDCNKSEEEERTRVRVKGLKRMRARETIASRNAEEKREKWLHWGYNKRRASIRAMRQREREREKTH